MEIIGTANKQLYPRYDLIAEMEIIMKMEHALSLIATFEKDEPTVKLLKLIAICTTCHALFQRHTFMITASIS